MSKTPARIAAVLYTRPDGSLQMRRRYYVPAGFNTWALHQKFQAPEGLGVQVVVEGQAKPEHGYSDRLVPLQQAVKNKERVGVETSAPPPPPPKRKRGRPRKNPVS